MQRTPDNKFAVAWSIARRSGRGITLGWATAFLFMKKFKYSDEQIAEIKLRKMNLRPETLLSAYDTARQLHAETDAMAACMRFNGASVTIPLPNEVLKLVDASIVNNPTSRTKNKVRAVLVALALRKGLETFRK